MHSIAPTLAEALDAAHDADRALRRLRESGRAPSRALEQAEAHCDAAWAVVGELDRPVLSGHVRVAA